MKVGLFFGTFNPIHVGHLIIADYMANNTNLDKVWFVITPKSPFKQKESILENYHRLNLVKVAIDDHSKLFASDIEFNLKQPNFTSDTLAFISEKYPDFEFSLIMGEDNLRSFHKWKNYKYLLDNYPICVYPRFGDKDEFNYSEEVKEKMNLGSIQLYDVPMMNVSSSYIRKAIKNKKSVKFLLPEKINQYVAEMHFYE